MYRLFVKLRYQISAFQQRQEGDALTEFAVVFVLTSIILLSSLHLLANQIDQFIDVATSF